MKNHENYRILLHEPYRLIFAYSGFVLVLLSMKAFTSNEWFSAAQGIALGSLLVAFAYLETKHQGQIWLGLIMAVAYGLKSIIELYYGNVSILPVLITTLVACVAVVDAVRRLAWRKVAR